MNKFSKVFVTVLFFLFIMSSIKAQDIQVIVHETYKDSTLGSEIVFDFEIINISSFEQSVFAIRTLNNLPSGWYSSLCFAQNCFPSQLDSVATTPDFNTPPLAPGDTLKSSLHVTALNVDGTANVQVQIGTFRNSTARTVIDFEATTPQVPANEILLVVHETYKDSTLGSEIVFDFEIINISSFEQSVFAIRTLNNLPSGWYSSLCFAQNCFPSQLDSVATTPDFNTPPLAAGDTLKSSIHVTALNVNGTANVQVQIGTFRNPTTRTVIDFEATTLPNSVDDNGSLPKEYYLGQNYPNPFNPSTKINFGLKKSGNVEIILYNILGNKVTTLLSEYKTAGNHTVNFNGSNLSSGAYLYKIVSNGFVQTKKMLLVK